MDSLIAVYRPDSLNPGSHQVLNEVAKGVFDQAIASQCPHFIQNVRKLDGLHNCAGLMGLIWSEQQRDDFTSLGIPVVNVSNTKGIVSGVANVQSDDVAVGEWAAEHLLQRQYHDFIAIGYKGRVWSNERLAGFEKALQGKFRSLKILNLELDAPGKMSGPVAYSELIWEQVYPVLDNAPPDTGIFTASDWLAWPLMNIMQTQCPERVYTSGLLGVDNLHDSLFDPRRTAGLSSILPGFRTAGSIGLSLLMDADSDQKVIHHIHQKVPPERLIPRASTAGNACSDPVIGKIIRELWGSLRRGYPISLRQVAKDNHIGLRSMEMRFENGVGVPARSLLADMRIELGKDLLTHTDLPIAEISNRCGYSNTTTFSNTFRKAVGQTPRDWRKTHQHPFAVSSQSPRIF